jgi:hypothetical protein
VVVSVACALLTTGCSFEQTSLNPAGTRPVGTAPTSSGSGDDSDRASPPPPLPTLGTEDSDEPGQAPPPPLAIDGAIDPPADAGSMAGAGAGAGPEQDAGKDAGELDSGEPECEEEKKACVCAHDRRDKPDDACAAPTCKVADCAPDDDCELERFGDSVYYVCTNGRSREQAAERCESIDDMHLVDIGDEDEDAFLEDVISGKVWIGALADEDRIWSWSDGTEFFDEDEEEPLDDAYVNWDEDAGEPNRLGVGAGSVTCAILWKETGAWADTNCPAENGYVCEREL